MIFLLGQELAFHRGLGDYLLFAPQDSLISSNKGLFPFQVRRIKKPIFLILKLFFLLGYLAIQLLGLSVGTIIISPFPSFFRRRQKMLINKRRNSDPAAAGGNNANLDITAPRQTERTAAELCSFDIIWWSFLNLFVFSK